MNSRCDERHPERGGISQMSPPHALLQRLVLGHQRHGLRVLHSDCSHGPVTAPEFEGRHGLPSLYSP